MFQGGQPGGFPTSGPLNPRFTPLSTKKIDNKVVADKDDKLVDDNDLESKLNRGEIKDPTILLQSLQGADFAAELQLGAIMADYDLSEDAKKANWANEELEELGVDNCMALILPLTEKLMSTEVVIVQDNNSTQMV